MGNSFNPGGSYTGSANDARIPGLYFCNFTAVSNGPVTTGFGYLEVMKVSDSSIMQRVTMFTSTGNINSYVRYYANSQWYTWGSMTYTR